MLGHYEDARIIWGWGEEGACFTSTLFPITAKDDKEEEEEVLGLQVIAFVKEGMARMLKHYFWPKNNAKSRLYVGKIIFAIIDSRIVLRTFTIIVLQQENNKLSLGLKRVL